MRLSIHWTRVQDVLYLKIYSRPFFFLKNNENRSHCMPINLHRQCFAVIHLRWKEDIFVFFLKVLCTFSLLPDIDGSIPCSCRHLSRTDSRTPLLLSFTSSLPPDRTTHNNNKHHAAYFCDIIIPPGSCCRHPSRPSQCVSLPKCLVSQALCALVSEECHR